MLALRSEGRGLDGAVASGAQELVSPFRQRNRAQDFTFCDALWFPALFGGRIKKCPASVSIQAAINVMSVATRRGASKSPRMSGVAPPRTKSVIPRLRPNGAKATRVIVRVAREW